MTMSSVNFSPVKAQMWDLQAIGTHVIASTRLTSKTMATHMTASDAHDFNLETNVPLLTVADHAVSDSTSNCLIAKIPVS